MKKLNPKRDDLMQYHTKVGNITTNLKVKYILPYLNLAGQKF